MTCFTRRGADFGATALPWTSLALWPLTVGDGSVVPVPPLFAMALGLARTSAPMQAAATAAATAGVGCEAGWGA